MDKLDIKGLTKRYYVERDGRQVLALSDVSLTLAAGEFVAIVGPSGCGKTTLLNIVAGLLAYDVGTVAIDGQRVDGPGVDRAVVFQHSSLLPWRTIAGSEGPLVSAVLDGHRSPPMRIDKALWPLLPTVGDEGARVLIRSRPELLREIACPGHGLDIDTLEDLPSWS